MKIALVHDHLAQDGGAERVLKFCSKLFPNIKLIPCFTIQKKLTPFSKRKKSALAGCKIYRVLKNIINGICFDAGGNREF
jgi:hypothetical protein